MFKQLCIALSLALLVELTIVIQKLLTGDAINLMEHLVYYVITPTVCTVIILVLVNTFLKYYISKKDAGMQAVVFISAVLCACLIHVAIHNTVSSIYAILCLPIVVSILYIDIKPILFAYVLTCVSYLIFTFFVIPSLSANNTTHRFSEIITMLAIMTIMLMIANIVLKILTMLTSDLLDKSDAAKRDSFTKLLNHATFYDALKKWMLIYDKNQKEFSVIIFDIDDFKIINDTYGHDVGDAVLLKFANVITEHLGTSEYGFRYGGEEFVVLTRRDSSETQLLAESIRHNFSKACQSMQILDDEFITASAGTGTYNNIDFTSKRDFFSAADKALYVAKSIPGKNSVVAWDSSME